MENDEKRRWERVVPTQAEENSRKVCGWKIDLPHSCVHRKLPGQILYEKSSLNGREKKQENKQNGVPRWRQPLKRYINVSAAFFHLFFFIFCYFGAHDAIFVIFPPSKSLLLFGMPTLWRRVLQSPRENHVNCCWIFRAQITKILLMGIFIDFFIWICDVCEVAKNIVEIMGFLFLIRLSCNPFIGKPKKASFKFPQKPSAKHNCS